MTSDTGASASFPYRADIAGLRAVAVLGVLLFHLKISLFQGGFTGVDVFFVISGYLITRKILDDVASKKFSFLTFYTRRVNRILPALIFTVVITFIGGALWLPPEFFRSLAKESTHALLSISNIQYWREANEYFAPRAEQLGLLHFWSLSLEEQFYVVWPAFFVLTARFCRPAMAIGVAAAISFAIMMVWASKDIQAAFFLTPFRIFQFAIGALVIFSERRLLQSTNAIDFLFVAGILAIGMSFVAFGSPQPYPGLIALIPTLGAAALIHAGGRSRLSFILTNKLFGGIGAISYSLYLCHWPILFFARYIFGDIAETTSSTVVIAVATMIVGAAMYRFIEQPFRHGFGSYRSTIFAYGILIAAFATVSHTAFLQNGWAWRLNPSQTAAAELQSFGMQPCAMFAPRRCSFGELNGLAGVELVGDSYIQQYVAALDPILKQADLRGETSTVGGCPILSGTLLKGPRLAECRNTRDKVLGRLKTTTVPVIIGHAWNSYSDEVTISEDGAAKPSIGENQLAQLKDGIEKTIEDIGQNGRRIMLVGAQVINQCKIDRARLLPGPLWHAPPPPCPATLREDAEKHGMEINNMLQEIQRKRPDQITLLRPIDYLCDETCTITSDGNWLYQDEGHFTAAGSRFIGIRARDVLERFLRPPSANAEPNHRLQGR